MGDCYEYCPCIGNVEVGEHLDEKSKNKKQSEKFDEPSFNSVIPISIVLEAGVLIFSVASYIFTTDKDHQPYRNTYLRLEQVFIAIVVGAILFNSYWLFHYRHSGHIYTKVVRIVRILEGCALIAGVVILTYNAFKINSECKTEDKCHKIEAKLIAVGLAIIDVVLHCFSPVDSIMDMVIQDNNNAIQITMGSLPIQQQPQPTQVYRPATNSVAVKVSPLAY